MTKQEYDQLKRLLLLNLAQMQHLENIVLKHLGQSVDVDDFREAMKTIFTQINLKTQAIREYQNLGMTEPPQP